MLVTLRMAIVQAARYMYGFEAIILADHCLSSSASCVLWRIMTRITYPNTDHVRRCIIQIRHSYSGTTKFLNYNKALKGTELILHVSTSRCERNTCMMVDWNPATTLLELMNTQTHKSKLKLGWRGVLKQFEWGKYKKRINR